MCGICGVLCEKVNDFPIGSMLEKMMASQQIRAQDSTGVAIFSHDIENNGGNNNDIHGSTVRLQYFIENQEGAYQLCEEKVLSTSSSTSTDEEEELKKLLNRLQSNPHIIITSLSRNMKLVKDIGLARDLNSRYKIRAMHGSHGIGHLRIATSSRVTPYNAHPFSTTIIPDIAIVHNGEITNYSRLRDELELAGYPFYTTCDSEVIAVFIADQLLRNGNDIEKAHCEFVRRADGPFTYIAATPTSMALVRDRFGSRKGVIGYNPGSSGNNNNNNGGGDYPAFWAMATDLSALDLVGATDHIETPSPGRPRIFYRSDT